MTNQFDAAAATWDENPVHLERSRAIATKMLQTLPLSKKLNALEYGAGTGILSFLLADQLGHITMMDSSAGMVKVMEEKVVSRGVNNLTPLFFDLERQISELKFDFIYNQMVLHHISEVESIFEKFFHMLPEGGILSIADLYTEDGSFHGEGFDGHLGFEPGQLKELLLKAGFVHVNYEECYRVIRKLPDSVTRSYPVFLLTASK